MGHHPVTVAVRSPLRKINPAGKLFQHGGHVFG